MDVEESVFNYFWKGKVLDIKMDTKLDWPFCKILENAQKLNIKTPVLQGSNSYGQSRQRRTQTVWKKK